MPNRDLCRIRIDCQVDPTSDEFKVWQYLKTLYRRTAGQVVLTAAVHLYRQNLYRDDSEKAAIAREEAHRYFLTMLSTDISFDHLSSNVLASAPRQEAEEIEVDSEW